MQEGKEPSQRFYVFGFYFIHGARKEWNVQKQAEKHWDHSSFSKFTVEGIMKPKIAWKV